MRKIFIASLLYLGVAEAALAAPMNIVEILPNSNELNQTVVKSSAVSPTAITVSSSSATRIDLTVNTKLSTALGAAYQRAEVIAQNTGSTNIYCAFSASEATTSAAWCVYPTTTWVFKLGKHEAIYCLSATSAGELRVGALGWK